MQRPITLLITAPLLAAALLLGAAPAGAQDAPADAPPPETTTPAPSSTTIAPPPATAPAPSTPGTTTSTTTPAVPDDTTPPPIPSADQLLDEPDPEPPAPTNVPRSVPRSPSGAELSLPLSAEELVASRLEADEAERRLADLDAEVLLAAVALQELTDGIAALEARLNRLDASVRTEVRNAATARQELIETATEFLIVGGDDAYDRLLAAAAMSVTPSDSVLADVYLDSASERKGEVLEEVRRRYKRLSSAQADLADELAETRVRSEAARAELAGIEQRRDETRGAVEEIRERFRTGESFLINWRFPIDAPANFINDWGFPRSGGRTHQGTDVFAAHGAPLVAVESGVIQRIGTNQLGGLIVWLDGDSGISYYYAHLSAFAPDLVAGMRVAPGDPIGQVGTSGNAMGTPPHLHFQVHPGGGDAANPYPLLKLAKDTALLLAAREGRLEPEAGSPAPTD